MSNDHYVPQSFLRAWSFDSGQKKLFRYQRVAATGRVVFGERSIRSLASTEDLYSVSDGTERASFEHDIMSRQVDDPISKALAKFREAGLKALGDDERDQLGRLVLTLEARNPETIRQMQLSKEQLREIAERAGQLGRPSSPSAVDDVAQFFARIHGSSGNWAAGMYSSWGYGRDLAMLKQKRWLQVDGGDGVHTFVTSSYPTMRGAVLPFEHDDHVSSLAVSPRRALMIAAPAKLEQIKSIGPLAIRLINMMTIGAAHEAYTQRSTPDPWIERHLGWTLRVAPEDRAAYFAAALVE